jgi:hypothetical protein
VTAEPPSETGAVHARATCPLPRTADVRLGGPGTVAAGVGVAVRAFELGPVPTAFVAVTVKE